MLKQFYVSTNAEFYYINNFWCSIAYSTSTNAISITCLLFGYRVDLRDSLLGYIFAY